MKVFYTKRLVKELSKEMSANISDVVVTDETFKVQANGSVIYACLITPIINKREKRNE